MTLQGWRRTSLGALTGLVAAGALYQLVSEAMDKWKFPAPGDLVDVGGHRLHIYGTGEGSPTVVLDSGYNGSWLDWSWVQPEVAKFTRVVSYDRAGLGWSDPAKPRSIQRIVNELHRLLANAGVGGRVHSLYLPPPDSSRTGAAPAHVTVYGIPGHASPDMIRGDQARRCRITLPRRVSVISEGHFR